MPRTKLRAAAARKSARYDEDEYFVEEPNVKLSRAFVVVLLLHVVAVGGIFAFSTLKDRQSSANTAKNQPVSASPTSTPLANVANVTNARAHASSQTLVYQVKTGDTLAGIAAQFGLTAHDLETANNLAPGTIVAIGRDLVIPEHANAKTGGELEKLLDSHQSAGRTTGGAGGENGKFYTIQRGDNPASIAKKFRITASELLRVNNIDDPKKLQIGQRLLIP
ncbi:MAG: LysM peptidoglycan-binding domain-containing protein [Verrucomicrobia bacterium]|nr:LysM peptidoglycan-binding domain-containing protein [Verrucomicrobiota bacterium]